MPSPRGRPTARQLIVAVAAAAVALFLLRTSWRLVEVFIDDPYVLGRTTGMLARGQSVVLAGNCRALPSGRAIRPTGRTDDKSLMYEWRSMDEGEYTPGGLTLAAGTTGVVEIDPAWDEDACYRDRPIAVKVTGGPNQGASLAVPRRMLRKR